MDKYRDVLEASQITTYYVNTLVSTIVILQISYGT